MIRILPYGEKDAGDVFSRAQMKSGEDRSVTDIVTAILRDVREKGDEALYAYTEKLDHVKLEALEVSREEIDAATEEVGKEFLAVLRKAAERIRAFHACQVRTSFMFNEGEGTFLGQKILPIEKVGLYIPGGTAAYPSSVLMNAIPAKLAGVKELVMTTPPTGGRVNPAILAAAKVARVSRVFALGGAQAVGALAYGTQSVPRVDKIVGPGNAFVAEAKRQVYGLVAIDMIAGPSEILVVADGKSNPVYVAADLLSQAEHDKNASAVLVTESAELARSVQAEIERQLSLLPREEIARESIEANGKIILVDTLETAMDIVNALAPEHLELCVDQPFDLVDRVRNAGSVFLGRYCPEALGDYFAGPNHTLPTGGTARFSSPLSVDDFVKKTQVTYFSPEALRGMAEDVALFAEREGLHAHARSVTVRGEEM